MKYNIKQDNYIISFSNQIFVNFYPFVATSRYNCIILLFIHNKNYRIYPMLFLLDFFFLSSNALS